MRLPQELFAEALWLEWFLHYGNVCEEKLPDFLRRYNLKLKKKKTLDDVKLACECKLPVHFYGRSGGMIPVPSDIAEKAKEIMGEVALVRAK